MTAELWSDPPIRKQFFGLIEQRRKTGEIQVCDMWGTRGQCTRRVWRPAYKSIWVRGPVWVYEVRGTICFRHRGIVSASVAQLALDLHLPKNNGPSGGKHVRFVWGFDRAK
ncbi:MAG: hypothetical protein HYY84_04740 [Deltaproteobacteria bacterium]|nr:hypothetical protein [Deltaproteobacteria bacterium]